MSYFGEVKIKDNFGWERKIELEKPLVLIGSAPSNDICLPEGHGGGVAPIHLQLICSGKSENSFRLFNISDLQVSIMEQVSGFEVTLLPGQARLIGKDDVLRIGEFFLSFKLLTSEAIVNEERTENIGMTLELPESTLHPGEKLSGLISVKNFGARKRCQFEIDLHGLPEDCYQIAPAPLLYPGAEEKLLIRFFHRKIKPAAGQCEIVIRATAAASYPTEQILLHQVLTVLPVFDCEIEIGDDSREPEALKEENVPPEPLQQKPVRIQAENPAVEEPQPVVVNAADIPRPAKARETAAMSTSWLDEEMEAEDQPMAESFSAGSQWVQNEDPLEEESKTAGEVFPVEAVQKMGELSEEEQKLPDAQTTGKPVEKEENFDQGDFEKPEPVARKEELFKIKVATETEMKADVEFSFAAEDEANMQEAVETAAPDLLEETGKDEEQENVAEEDWWGDEDDFQSSLGKRSNLNSFNRNVRSRLTRNEVQVIRASKNDENSEMEQE